MRLHRPCLIALLVLSASPAAALPPDGGHTLVADQASDQVSAEFDKQLVQRVNENLATLARAGKAPAPAPPRPQAITGMTWPMGPVDGIGTAWSGISNFVDLNPAYPNQLRDYTCATRTYDNAGGYNHRGIDYFIWPFPWHLMDSGAVDVLAAAPGTLIEKRDGYSDRSCSFDAPDTANYVIILHADGSIARYLHLKRGSVTALPIGSVVTAGTVLGKVGSSGISTGPHLHFELRASNAVNAPVVDPNNGQCNAIPTSWASQRPYRDTRINRLSTHSAAPVFPVCPNTYDQPNFKDSFAPGDPLTVVSAYRDLGRGMVTQFRILRPDQSVFASWSFDMAETGDTPPYYNGAYWYWNHVLPANAPQGLWTVEATLNGQASAHTFQVRTGAVTEDGPLPPELSGSWYNVDSSGQGFNLELVNDRRFVLYFYGYDDSGRHLWLFGDYDPAALTFDYGEPMDVPMYFVSGGRFNGFDPAAITSRVWGTARIEFISCKRASVVLTGETGTQTLVLDKLLTPVGLTCAD